MTGPRPNEEKELVINRMREEGALPRSHVSNEAFMIVFLLKKDLFDPLNERVNEDRGV